MKTIAPCNATPRAVGCLPLRPVQLNCARACFMKIALSKQTQSCPALSANLQHTRARARAVQVALHFAFGIISIKGERLTEARSLCSYGGTVCFAHTHRSHIGPPKPVPGYDKSVPLFVQERGNGKSSTSILHAAGATGSLKAVGR